MHRKEPAIEVIVSERLEPSAAWERMFQWLLMEDENGSDLERRSRQNTQEGNSRDVRKT